MKISIEHVSTERVVFDLDQETLESIIEEKLKQNPKWKDNFELSYVWGFDYSGDSEERVCLSVMLHQEKKDNKIIDDSTDER